MAKGGRTNRAAAGGDIVIVGAGLAGLFTALKLAPAAVTLVSPAPLGEGAASAWAQGGIAAAVGEGDTPELHAADTVRAGAGIVDERIARLVAMEAGERVRDLLAYGVPFDRDLAGHFVLSREAAHSASRVVRVSGDKAGLAIMEAVIHAVRRTRSITVLEDFSALRLISTGNRVTGVELARTDDPAAVHVLDGARAVVLATGGIGGLYAVTTNPPHARGEGVAIAVQAGAAIADAEFVQFHPTALDVGLDPAPLATEALRGEGAVLINAAGERFMAGLHPDAELAPRDVVARAVFAEIAAGRGAFLDCRNAIGPRLPTAFPTVYERCRAAGIDPVTEPVPVAPAEHYHMGGVRTDEWGRTGAAGLWAAGEVASTGLHGANRLASNSLLETVVFGARVAADIARLERGRTTQLELSRTRATHLPDFAARAEAIRIIRTTMSRHVGVEREAEGLDVALKTLVSVADAAEGDPVIGNAVLAARLVAECALRRKESRGAHYRRDFPHPSPRWQRRSAITLAGLDLRSALESGALSGVIGTE
ncbi:MAG: L-aspartate oxidase [Hyphomicrobiaceae bacterium]|nr:L-aspartate oxidase [Hyphomicrobiaceae bacterium]